MLAVLGFVTILLVLALIMSKKVSTLVALIFVPAITGFIAAFINAPNVIIQAAQAAAEKAGTAYVEPVITFGTRFTKALSILSADYMGKGLSSIVATGVMFIFAILFFSTCSDAGVFDPIINRILKFTGEDPVKVCIGTFLIGCICHLDGSGATTFLIAIPACMPLFQKLKMNLWVEATIVALAAGIMNVMPWGGPTVRAAAAMSGLGYEVTGSELWVGIMPAWIAGLEVTGLTEAKTTSTSNELARSGWRWYFNVALILVILYILVTNRLSPAITFMIGYCVLLIVNYPSVDLQHKIINSHAQAAFLMVSIVFAAGAFTGVVKNSGMLAAMTDALVSIIPTSMGTFIAPVVGLFSVPLSLLFDPDSYYYGVMPVIANAVSAMGGNALAVAKASIMGQMTLGFPLSPLTGATFLLLGLSGQDLGDHQKHTLPYAWFASAIMVAVGCVACGLLF
ncbi:citrate transporter [Faecalibacterium prausnitzii]|uniref:CitMHS family transporter n=1 Tax=Faecalibacterium prausnitzii TaxID=853 RepID=UPI001EDD4F41|nr:SLC13 family permease [Faecalibacterium prausnitzii]MCG4604333.1 citrate transporter [Faecalibacterium prausnitzii]